MERRPAPPTYLNYRNGNIPIRTGGNGNINGIASNYEARPQLSCISRVHSTASNYEARPQPTVNTNVNGTASNYEARPQPAVSSARSQPSVNTNVNGAASNYEIRPQPAVSPARPPPVAAPPAAVVQSHSNTLLIFLSDGPSPDMHVYLSTILSRYTISEVALIASSDEVLKVTRMDIYTAAGRMRQDILVTTTRLAAPISATELVQGMRGLETKTLIGVLCCQHSSESSTRPASIASSSPPKDVPAPRDILDYDEVEMELSWRTTFLTLHTLARATVPLLRRAPLTPSPFFCLDSTLPPTPLDTPSQSSLLTQLSASPASQGLRFGLAREELIPAPSPMLSQRSSAVDIPAGNGGWNGYGNGNATRGGGGGVYGNGNGNGNGNGGEYFAGNGNGNGAQGLGLSPQSPESLPESPTKMWATWAMLNE